jgi:transposase
MTVKQDNFAAGFSTIGMDLGDKYSRVCVLDEAGEIIEEGRVPTSDAGLMRKFRSLERHRIVIETGTHSNWVHDLLVGMGHEVVVANARKVRAISANERKCDELDARMLARLGRSDPRLLYPVSVRPEQMRADLCLLRARDKIVEARTEIANSVRGLIKSMGRRMPRCGVACLHKQPLDPRLEHALRPLMASLEALTTQIKECDQRLEELYRECYPQAARVRQVSGVGLITSLYFVLAIADPKRFCDPRVVAAYFGLVSRRDQSGGHDPQLRISKCGDPMGRKLLVECAQHILTHGPDSDLRRFGLRLTAQGGKRAKKRAVVATARKLAVLLFALLRSGEVYEPLRNSAKSQARP